MSISNLIVFSSFNIIKTCETWLTRPVVPVVGQPREVVQQVGALPPADGPLGDVVRPDVGRHGGGGLAVAVGKRKNDSLLQGK